MSLENALTRGWYDTDIDGEEGRDSYHKMMYENKAPIFWVQTRRGGDYEGRVAVEVNYGALTEAEDLKLDTERKGIIYTMFGSSGLYPAEHIHVGQYYVVADFIKKPEPEMLKKMFADVRFTFNTFFVDAKSKKESEEINQGSDFYTRLRERAMSSWNFNIAIPDGVRPVPNPRAG